MSTSNALLTKYGCIFFCCCFIINVHGQDCETSQLLSAWLSRPMTPDGIASFCQHGTLVAVYCKKTNGIQTVGSSDKAECGGYPIQYECAVMKCKAAFVTNPSQKDTTTSGTSIPTLPGTHQVSPESLIMNNTVQVLISTLETTSSTPVVSSTPSNDQTLNATYPSLSTAIGSRITELTQKQCETTSNTPVVSSTPSNDQTLNATFPSSTAIGIRITELTLKQSETRSNTLASSIYNRSTTVQYSSTNAAIENQTKEFKTNQSETKNSTQVVSSTGLNDQNKFITYPSLSTAIGGQTTEPTLKQSETTSSTQVVSKTGLNDRNITETKQSLSTAIGSQTTELTLKQSETTSSTQVVSRTGLNDRNITETKQSLSTAIGSQTTELTLKQSETTNSTLVVSRTGLNDNNINAIYPSLSTAIGSQSTELTLKQSDTRDVGSNVDELFIICVSIGSVVASGISVALVIHICKRNCKATGKIFIEQKSSGSSE